MVTKTDQHLKKQKKSDDMGSIQTSILTTETLKIIHRKVKQTETD